MSVSLSLHLLEEAAVERERADDVLNAAAKDYARSATLAWSIAHPRRTVTFCAAMGSVSMSATSHGKAADYDFTADHFWIAGKRFDPLPFLRTLETYESRLGIRYALGGDMLLVCKAGRILSEKSDW